MRKLWSIVLMQVRLLIVSTNFWSLLYYVSELLSIAYYCLNSTSRACILAISKLCHFGAWLQKASSQLEMHDVLN